MPPSGVFSARITNPALHGATHFTLAYICVSWNSFPSSSNQPPFASFGVPTISPFWTFQSACPIGLKPVRAVPAKR